MTLSSERMMKLMAFADGEFDDAERREVESWLANDADAVRFANDLANLGDLVQLGHERSPDAKAAASFDVADLVIAKVTSEPKNVSSLDAARARRRTIGTAAAAALALAASVFVMVRNKEEQPIARGTVPVVQPAASGGPGVDVDVVQTPGQSVGVYYLPNEASLTTSVVVWVDETGEK